MSNDIYIDARKLEDNTVVQGDIAIIGGGAAGITLAKELAKSSLSVVVLESGGKEGDVETQDLYQGENVNDKYINGLIGSRSRFLGGSTNCWHGLCLPLSAADFKKHPWIPYSGWPYELDTLKPYYKRAAKQLELRQFSGDPKPWLIDSEQDLSMSGEYLDTNVFQLSRVKNFAEHFNGELRASKSLKIYLYSNLTNLRTEKGGEAIARGEFKTLSGVSFTVKAKRYVLATGAIENARLLLNCKDDQKNGLGNERDLVGRFFMEHPHMDSESEILFGAPKSAFKFYGLNRRRRNGIWPSVQPSARTREKFKILNSALVLFKPKKTHGDNSLAAIASSARVFGEQTRHFDIEGSAERGKPPFLYEFGHPSEQSPNPDSRITLSDNRDPLGLYRTRLDWNLSEIDSYSREQMVLLLARQLGKSGLGRIKMHWKLGEYALPEKVLGGCHHMGTTRMHDSPSEGVVNSDCRVHGVKNLFVAGSSVFPTGGVANPTFTIVALAIKLADYLKSRGS